MAIKPFLPILLIIFVFFTFNIARSFSLKTSTNSTIMSLSSEEKIKEIVRRQALGWQNAAPEAIVSDFSEDAIFIAPGFTFKGKQQIKEAAEKYFTQFTDTQITIKRIIASGNEGAVEWDWSDRSQKTGEKSDAEDAIIFELEGDKIKYWREYIDKQTRKNEP